MFGARWPLRIMSLRRTAHVSALSSWTNACYVWAREAEELARCEAAQTAA